jgi:hypothetical protein
MKKLSKQITENYAQTGEANDEKVPIIISDDISYSGMQIRQESGMINRHVPRTSLLNIAAQFYTTTSLIKSIKLHIMLFSKLIHTVQYITNSCLEGT